MRPLFLLLSLLPLSACGPEPQVVTRVEVRAPAVPADLLRPVPAPDLAAEDATDVARIIVGYDQALDTANGKIAAIADILGPQ